MEAVEAKEWSAAVWAHSLACLVNFATRFECGEDYDMGVAKFTMRIIQALVVQVVPPGV